ncbi:MAG: right-handed parallel beta-helix repeat-containing protein, partial [Armatimonadota bacterium]
KIRIEQRDITVEGLVFDWRFCGSDGIRIYNDRVALRDCELRNTGGSGTPPGDALELNGCDRPLIEGCYIHHCLTGRPGVQEDAHGITGYPTNAVIRNTEVAYITGDAIQFSPSRRPWGPVLVEGCDLLTGPLPPGLPAGTDWEVGDIPGENGLDTKQREDNPRSRIVLRDCRVHGFRGVLSMRGSNAAINAKDHVEVLLDRCTVYDNDWGFRLRGPGSYSSSGSYDTLTNCVMYDNGKAVRYEDDIRNLHIYNCTFGRNDAFFQSAGGHGAGLEVMNCLFFGGSKPEEAADSSNLATMGGFVNPGKHDYRLTADSPAIDSGVATEGVTADRDGAKRPQGPACDVGAYERVP